jgi:hypothetical protein
MPRIALLVTGELLAGAHYSYLHFFDYVLFFEELRMAVGERRSGEHISLVDFVTFTEEVRVLVEEVGWVVKREDGNGDAEGI